MDDAEATADQMFRDLMNKVFPSNGTAPSKNGLYRCQRCDQVARIPPNRALFRGCWEDLGRPGGRREIACVHQPGSIPGKRSNRAESGGIAYHGGQFNAGEW